MTLTFRTLAFDEAAPRYSHTRTEDAQTLSILFDDLSVHSSTADESPEPEARRVDATVHCQGSGWVSVQARGAALVVGAHGLSHFMAWANGRRLQMTQGPGNEPWSAAITAPVPASGILRLSLLLLAQRDLADAQAGAACWVDSLDLVALTTVARAWRSRT